MDVSGPVRPRQRGPANLTAQHTADPAPQSKPQLTARTNGFGTVQRYEAGTLEAIAYRNGREVSRSELPFEFMLNALRLKEGFELQQFRERTGLPLTAIDRPLQEAERKGLIERSLSRVRPTPRGFDFLSDLQGLFLTVQ